MDIAVTGSRGLVGSALVRLLAMEGHQVIRLVRASAGGDDVLWDPVKGVERT